MKKKTVFEGLTVTRTLGKNLGFRSWSEFRIKFGYSKAVWTKIAKLGCFGISVLSGVLDLFYLIKIKSLWLIEDAMIQLIWRIQLRARLVTDISTGELLFLEVFFGFATESAPRPKFGLCTVSLLSSKLLTPSSGLGILFDKKWWKWVVRPFGNV